MNFRVFVTFLTITIICNTESRQTLAEIQYLRANLAHPEKKQTIIAAFEEFFKTNPNDATAHFEYGSYLAELDDRAYDIQAITHIKHAINLEKNIHWLFFLGCLGCRIGAMQDAINAYTEILKIQPSQLPVLYNMGYTLKNMGNNEAAIALYRKVLSINPDYEPAHLGLSFALINSGQFKEGWQEHEWNLKFQKKNAEKLRELLSTNSIAGKKILLLPEGGFGDTLNFLRYAQRLKHMGAFVIAAVQTPLVPLLSRCTYIDYLMPINQYVPAHDASATFMSLAPIFADDEDTIPRNIPYIFADPERIAYWHEKLKNDTNFKIGICWQPDVHNDVSRLAIARRGIPLSHFFRLGSTPGITLYSLQKKEGLEQLANVPASVKIHIFDESFDNIPFTDTAALMHEMDLIISADTATAHLAGALGRPVWLMLPYATDWRWLNGRSDSPWYPTMRIFKQPKPYDWDSMMEEIHSMFFDTIFTRKKKESL